MYISQCTCDNDIVTFRHIFRNWINHCGSEIIEYGLYKIPFGKRYFQMNHVCRDWTVGLDKMAAQAMRPETDFDRHESALWLNDLLHHLQRERVR